MKNMKMLVVFLCLLFISFSSALGFESNDSTRVEELFLMEEMPNHNIHLSHMPHDFEPVIQNPIISDYDGDIIVFTANQGWLSRIYILDMNGYVLNYFEYEFYHFVDTEVVNNELYVSEGFAPRVYKVDVFTGDLDVIVDDWSLYYFYGLAFDGAYFYVDEWDLNRYDINGDKDSTASFDEDVFGSTWNGEYYWTLDDSNLVKCWDISNWPSINQVTENNFIPPSPNCRGLWFDGEYFWTAESIEDTLGFIYQFNYNGEIINQWLEPAFSGWSACVIDFNDPPSIPNIPSGPNVGIVGSEYNYSASSTDNDNDQIYYQWDWGDGNKSDWMGAYESGEECLAFHIWNQVGLYNLRVRAKDIWNSTSDWSDVLSVIIYTLCGDVNADGNGPDISDLVYLVDYMFQGGPVPPIMCQADIDGNGSGPDIADLVYLVEYMFQNGDPPAENCCL